MNEPQTTPVDPRVHLQDALEHLRAALAVTPATILAAREIEEAIDHAELAISDLDDGGTAEDDEDDDVRLLRARIQRMAREAERIDREEER